MTEAFGTGELAGQRLWYRALHGPTPLTWGLISLTVLAFGAQCWLEWHLRGQGLAPAEAEWASLFVLGVNLRELSLGGQPWRLLSSAFLHAGVLHLGLNMASLLSLGRLVERLAGPWRLLGFYLAAALVSGLASALFQAPASPSLGASGALFGLAGLALATRWRRVEGFPQGLSQALYRWLAKPLGLIFVIGLALQALKVPVQLDNAAHAGGLCFGFGLGYLYPSFLVRPLGLDRV